MEPRPSRPTTPLRRISSHSLRSLSLSHSQSQSTGSGLSHLGPLFCELSDSISDLVSNCESLGHISNNLDKFNESFSSYLYGLRINSYTFDFKHPPNKINFDLANERRLRQFELQQQQQQQVSPPRSPTNDDFGGGGDADRTATNATMMMMTTASSAAAGAADSTFMTNDEHSFIQPTASSSSRSNNLRGRGASSGIARGRGRGTGRIGTGGAGGGGVMTKRKKEEISAFADPVFPLLPINLRENRRNECEKVLWALKEHPNGMGLSDLTKHLSGQTPPIPQVRINEVLLALVRAKVATKGLIKGVNLYRLDQNRVA